MGQLGGAGLERQERRTDYPPGLPNQKVALKFANTLGGTVVLTGLTFALLTGRNQTAEASLLAILLNTG